MSLDRFSQPEYCVKCGRDTQGECICEQEEEPSIPELALRLVRFGKKLDKELKRKEING